MRLLLTYHLALTLIVMRMRKRRRIWRKRMRLLNLDSSLILPLQQWQHLRKQTIILAYIKNLRNSSPEKRIKKRNLAFMQGFFLLRLNLFFFQLLLEGKLIQQCRQLYSYKPRFVSRAWF